MKRYGVADADVMAMVSVIYTGSARTKLETQLYREYIEEWRSSNRDYFISDRTFSYTFLKMRLLGEIQCRRLKMS